MASEVNCRHFVLCCSNNKIKMKAIEFNCSQIWKCGVGDICSGGGGGGGGEHVLPVAFLVSSSSFHRVPFMTIQVRRRDATKTPGTFFSFP